MKTPLYGYKVKTVRALRCEAKTIRGRNCRKRTHHGGRFCLFHMTKNMERSKSRPSPVATASNSTPAGRWPTRRKTKAAGAGQ